MPLRWINRNRLAEGKGVEAHEGGKEEGYRKFFRLWILLIFLPRPTHRAVEASSLLGRLRGVEGFHRVRLNLFSPTPSGSEPLHRV